MPNHENKNCLRCAIPFECKVGSIQLCQCYGITLTEEERYYMVENYEDCLCAKCMIEIRSEFHNKKLSGQILKLLRR